MARQPTKILVAELEVEVNELQLEEVDVHEWDLYTRRMEFKTFLRLFYSETDDANSFNICPYPTLVNTEGYDQEELDRQGW